MNQPVNYREHVDKRGFAILNNIYTGDEVASILNVISKADQSNKTFRKSEDLFAIRQFLKGVPQVKELVFNNRLKELIGNLFGGEYFLVKSIYFDKPEKSNWFVAWHQDLTISVNKKTDLPGYGPWTTKLNQFAVQPPLDILQDNFTIRIHLDDTDEANGALKVIPGSHLKGVWRTDDFNPQTETATICDVSVGGVMIMRPLLMHSSNRSIANRRRRVIHIEFSRVQLPQELNWAEREDIS
jgi:ectoine hydroxylase-related dioxygenase (phytanoyl-CoA dioxygenase family)